MGDNGGVAEYDTFEEFLDSQVAPIDLFYLEVCTISTFINWTCITYFEYLDSGVLQFQVSLGLKNTG